MSFSKNSFAFLYFLFTLLSFISFGQKTLPVVLEYINNEDSICKSGKRYKEPQRITINFPAKNVTDKYKISELHKAIPDSLNDENNEKWWFYNYYFNTKVTDYEPKGDSVFTPAGDNLLYKLKDTYFFDINGDGLLDFIHYPEYYRALMADQDIYELFLQVKNGGYKWVTFRGFIVDIYFNTDRTLNKMKTYRGPCCDDNHATFFWYTFDKKSNDLILINKETILTCQLVK